MRTIHYLLMCACVGTCSLQADAKVHTLQSPDGRLRVEVNDENQLAYTLKFNNRILLDESPVGMQLTDRTWGATPKVKRVNRRTAVKEHIVSPNYRTPAFDVTYNEMDIRLKDDYGIVFRAYDEGVAYRFYTTLKTDFVVENETAVFNFPQDYKTYMAYSTASGDKDPYAMAFQNLYTQTPVSQSQPGRIAFLPVTMDCGEGVKMTLLESDLEQYPGMFVTHDSGTSLKADFAPYPTQTQAFPPRAMTKVTERGEYIARGQGARNFPWRIWAVTTDDRQMPVNNLVYALASPNRIGDTSWIKTGKVAWDWWNDWGLTGVNFKAGINMPTYKHYIDFAAENGIEFVVLDEGWYKPSSGDMLTVIPELNLEELIAYGKSRGVDLILWTVFNVLDNQLEEACKKYADMGISGFKVDFLDRDDQTAVEMTYRIAEATARHKLTLDLHGFYKPTGLNRTYPNIINFESVFGMEEVKWSNVDKDMMKYDVIMPYIRMMTGPVDYTPGAMRNATKKDFKPVYYNPMSQGTRCHQLAAYVVHDSPLTMLADSPTAYRQNQECTDFIVSLPNKHIEETRILQGTMGEYIVTARRIGRNWYVGGMTDWTPRDLSLSFDFLGEGTYDVILFTDGINAGKNASDYRKETFTATSATQRDIHLAAGGGFVLSITKK